MTEFELLNSLETTSKTNDKKAILGDAIINTKFNDLVNAAYDFFRKFHIKKIEVSGFNQESTDKHNDFLVILEALQTRQITGFQAKNLIENFLSSCNILQQKWYTRVVQKDLKIGVSITTLNKCGFNIPEFNVMLAKDAKKMKKSKAVVEQGVFVSPKLDGYRCLAIYDGKEVNLYSRNGSHYENFPTIYQTLTEALVGKSEPIVLDGEIMSDDFQSMQQSAFASVRGTTVGDVTYHLFGMIPYEEWINDEFKLDTRSRIDYLKDFHKKYLNNAPNIQLVPQTYTRDWDEILTLEAQYLQKGLEGAMALPATEPYYKGRKTNKLMKFKTFHTMECTVIDFYPGEKGTKYEHTLGGINVLQEDSKTQCGVGSGFTDEERDYIWNNQDSIKSRIMEVRYQDLTKDQVMRFPTFVRWRDQGQGRGKI